MVPIGRYPPIPSPLVPPHHPDHSRARAGIAFGAAAYLWWGLVPIYFKAISHVPAAEVLAHRIIWSVLLLWPLVLLARRRAAAAAVIRSPRTLLVLAASTLLIASNWFLYIWAVATSQVAQASLGYFITPLLNVLLGIIVLGERLRRAQLASFLLAAAGVAWLALSPGALPILALALAVSFSLYGLVRKLAPVDSLIGLTAETTILAPLALLYLALADLTFASGSLTTDVLLACGGIITATPLLFFVAAARRLTLTTLGFLQYFSPSIQLILAVLAYQEPFRAPQIVCFSLIWTSLAVFTLDALRQRRRAPSPT
jgi:chloramphenicol-sensitive protein RarD